jgi:acyl-CoA reductase-like NAD-dependent aldehyde dehydrogenase
LVNSCFSVLTSTNEIDEFVRRADNAYRTSLDEFGSRVRVEKFLHALDMVEANKHEICQLVCDETGKSMQLSQSEFSAALTFGRMLCYATMGQVGYVTTSSSIKKSVTIKRHSLGPALLVCAYNTPLPNLMWKLAPSFLAGNYSLVCPSPYVARSARTFVSLLSQAGIVNEEISVTNGDPILSEYATGLPQFRLISFTGSRQIGERVSKKSSANFPKLILELGGVNPIVIGSTSNLSSAAEASLISAFSNGGQRCAAGSLVLCRESEFLAFNQEITSLCQRPDFIETVQSINTPLISAAARERHHKFLDDVVESGAAVEVLSGMADGAATEPVLVRGLTSTSNLAHSELFSPVLRIIKVANLEESVEFANMTDLRLTAAIWTESIYEYADLMGRMKVGLINLNSFTFGSEPNFPFGGLGMSGNGSRDAGFSALEEYSQTVVRTVSG